MSDHAAQTPNRWIPSPKVRGYVYRVAAAAGPVVLFYGLMTAHEYALWLGLGGTVLSVPQALAAANTPKEPPA